MKHWRVLLLLAAQASILHGEPAARRTYCNPLDINYQYESDRRGEGVSYRSGADPVLLLHGGEYYLFVTDSHGWWHSNDLSGWEYIRPDIWPADDMCAPAVVSVRDTLYLLQSTFDRRPLYYTTQPEAGLLKYFNPLLPPLPGALGPWDPDLFHDEKTDRWYLYFGSSNFYPIYGIELDHAEGLTYIGQARPLIALDPAHHGWERFGRDHRDTTRPYVEGAWMTEHDGKYYLQYAAPGTEENVYANGTCVGDYPLGPFTYAPYNPVSYKPGGFMTGAGHGNTFQDLYGNYWNTGTPWVAVNWKFERRIAMFPSGFDRDGHMYAWTRFGDFPHYLPSGKRATDDQLFTGWMLLSYRKPCTASSVLDTFAVSNVSDENPRTFWVAGSTRAGEWIRMDLEKECTVKAVQVNYTDYKSGIYASDSTVYTQFRLWTSSDGRTWKVVADLSHERRDRPDAYCPLDVPVKAREVKFEHLYVGSRYLAISDIRVFGNGQGRRPATPSGLAVRRDRDRRNAFIRWDAVPGAVGYNIMWGIAPDKLYQAYQVFADHGTRLELRSLTVEQAYCFAVEAFNENGVSPVSRVISGR